MYKWSNQNQLGVIKKIKQFTGRQSNKSVAGKINSRIKDIHTNIGEFLHKVKISYGDPNLAQKTALKVFELSRAIAPDKNADIFEA